MQDAPPLPSTRSLVLSLAASALLAGVALVLVVLPAEYGLDPTGFGKAVGLTQLSGTEEDLTALPERETGEAAADGLRSDTATIRIEAGDELEYKLRISAGSLLEYDWETDGLVVFSQLHGEPAGDASGYYEDFTVGRARWLKGSFEAPFDGTHGWFWKNDGSAPVTITLKTRGVYEVVGKL